MIKKNSGLNSSFMVIPRVDLGPQENPLKSAILSKISEVINSKEFILGKNVKQLEKEITDYFGVSDAVGVANGTEALTISLASLGIGKGDEVITTPFTMAANVESIIQVGAKPVFVDVDVETFNLIPEEIEKVISKKTKAILPVHLFGNPCNIHKIMEIAQKNNLYVIEDVCQAFGARYSNGKKCGSFGILSALSFFPTKNLGCYGDGGMILVNDAKISNKIRALRIHGQEKKYFYKYLGWNSRLDELQAAILLVKLPFIDKWNKERLEIAKLYNYLLSEIKEVIPPKIPDNNFHIFHLYTIKAEKRDLLEAFLTKNGISTSINYPLPLHLQEAYNHNHIWKKGDFPNAEYLCDVSISLPLFVGMTNEQVNYVCSKIKEFYKH